MHAGAFDQSAAARRSDVLVFATPPFDDELEVTGPVALSRGLRLPSKPVATASGWHAGLRHVGWRRM